jgi:hypothetical protein
MQTWLAHVLPSRLGMRSFAALALVVAGCSDMTSSGSSSSQSQEGGAQDGGTCHHPSSVDTDSDASRSGCFAMPPGQICQVSSGATVLPDGGVSGGTQSCKSLCGTSQYEVACRSTDIVGAIPDPQSSLGCKVIPIPTPSNALFYCCPCAEVASDALADALTESPSETATDAAPDSGTCPRDIPCGCSCPSGDDGGLCVCQNFSMPYCPANASESLPCAYSGNCMGCYQSAGFECTCSDAGVPGGEAGGQWLCTGTEYACTGGTF